MLRAIRFFLKEPLIRYSLAATILLIVAEILILALKIRPSAEPIFLHYTTTLGVDFIGAWYLAYALPLASLCIGVLNGILAFILARKDILLAYLLVIGSAMVSLLLLIQVILIVRVNS